MPPRYTIRQVVGTYRRKAFGTRNEDGSDRRPPYPPAAIAAFYGMLELAEEQPNRGRFDSIRHLQILLEGPRGQGRPMARQVPFLIEQGDLVVDELGAVSVEGWAELQEGDDKIVLRMARFNGRERPMTGAERQAAYRARHAAGSDGGSDETRDAPSDGVTVTK